MIRPLPIITLSVIAIWWWSPWSADASHENCPSKTQRPVKYCRSGKRIVGFDLPNMPLIGGTSVPRCYNLCIANPKCLAIVYKYLSRCWLTYNVSITVNTLPGLYKVAVRDNTVEPVNYCSKCGTKGKCYDLESLQWYRINDNEICGSGSGEVYYGDFNNDGICDAVCLTRNSSRLQWGVGTLPYTYTQLFDYNQPTRVLNNSETGYIGKFCDVISSVFVRDVNGDGYDDLVCKQVGQFDILYGNVTGLGLASESVLMPQPPQCVPLSGSCLLNSACTPAQSLCDCSVLIPNAPPNGYYRRIGLKLYLVCDAGYVIRGKQDGLSTCDGVTDLNYEQLSFCQSVTDPYEMHMFKMKSANLATSQFFEMSGEPTEHKCFWKCVDNLQCLWATYNFGSSTCMMFDTPMSKASLLNVEGSSVGWFPIY